MKSHFNEAEFQCNVCARHLRTMEAVTIHMHIHEQPFVIKCIYCGKPFSTKYSMKYHSVQQHILKIERRESKEDKLMIK